MCRRIFKEQTSESGDIPFYKIGTFGGEADAFISKELFEEYKAKYPYPKKGDILISASGSIGRTVEFTGENEYFQDSNIVWLNHDEHLDNSFLKWFYSVVKWVGIEGSTIKRLYNDNILNTVITLPSVAEQKKIGSYFANLDNLITLHQRINKVADIWLDTNIKAHNFIPAEYWKSNFKSVKEALLLAEVYVYEYDTEIQGFIGLNDEYVEGIFVSGEMQSQGIGKILLNYAKDKRNKLHLNVYQKNARAISFYKREGFEIQHSGLDEATGEKDYVMTWQHK